MVKEIRRVEIRIAQELEQIAMVLVRAGLGDDVDMSTAVVAVLGVEIIGQDAKLMRANPGWESLLRRKIPSLAPVSHSG